MYISERSIVEAKVSRQEVVSISCIFLMIEWFSGSRPLPVCSHSGMFVDLLDARPRDRRLVCTYVLRRSVLCKVVISYKYSCDYCYDYDVNATKTLTKSSKDTASYSKRTDLR